MTGDIYGIELIIPPEKTIAEVYEMREALLDDEDFSPWVSEEDIYDDGVHLTVEYHDVVHKSMVFLAERLGFIVDWALWRNGSHMLASSRGKMNEPRECRLL